MRTTVRPAVAHAVPTEVEDDRPEGVPQLRDYTFLSKEPLVSVVAVCTNESEELRNCLDSVYSNGWSDHIEVVVVDNASTDQSSRMVREHFPPVRVVANRYRHGFAFNANRGVRQSRAELVLLTNSDVEIPPKSIDRLVEFMEQRPDVAVCGPRIVYTDGRLQHSCRRFPSLPAILMRKIAPFYRLFPRRYLTNYLMLDWVHDRAADVDWVSTCCLMLRRSAFEAIGGFDERYFLYCEDVDWCFRAHEHGWRVVYFPEAFVVHRAAHASRRSFLNRNAVIHLRSMLRFWTKHRVNVFHPRARRPDSDRP